MRDGRVEPAGLAEQVADGIARLEARAGRRLGDPDDPLLVSVRSGARDSMPGMLETILDLGLNDESVRGMAARTGDAHFAWDSYRRFVQMFGNVVRGVPGERYEEILSAARRRAGVREDRGLSVTQLQDVTRRFRTLYETHTGETFPQDPQEQLRLVDTGRVRLVARRSRRRVSPHQPHPRRLGHGGQRAADGVRQHGRRARRPASRSRATRSPARPSRAATSCSTPRARTWSRACARRARCTSSPRRCPARTRSCSRSCARSRRTTATCRTSSSPSSAAACTCSRRAAPSARRRPPCASPSTPSTRGC